MNTTNQSSTFTNLNDTVMGRIYTHFSGHNSSAETRIILIIILAASVHITVKIIGLISEWLINKSQAEKKTPLGFVTQQPKFVTLVRLLANGATFVMYFLAFGLILQEFGINLTAYLASASIVGLAISFGSQGLVQDMVIGLTLIFSDAMDVGDLVEIAGTVVVVGRVEEIGLRFTKVLNFYNQKVFIPNRTIANVSRFPFGGVYAYADIRIPEDVDRAKAVQTITNIANGMWRQFGAIILNEPAIDQMETTDFVRVHFKIWPGQGNLIETTFRQQIVNAMKAFHPDYTDWQVTVTYRAITASKK